MRTTSQVTGDDCRHPEDLGTPGGVALDPTAPGYGEHLPFHAILQRCGLAWRDYIETSAWSAPR